MPYTPAEFAPLFKALADETRLKILELLARGEMCACDLLEHFQISQPTLSYHMKILSECGLVLSKRDGAWMRYTLSAQRFEEVRAFLNALPSKGTSLPPSGCC